MNKSWGSDWLKDKKKMLLRVTKNAESVEM